MTNYINYFRKLEVIAKADHRFARYFNNCVLELATTGRLVRTLDWFNANVARHTGKDLNLKSLVLTKDQSVRFRAAYGFLDKSKSHPKTRPNHDQNPTETQPEPNQNLTDTQPKPNQNPTKMGLRLAETLGFREPLSSLSMVCKVGSSDLDARASGDVANNDCEHEPDGQHYGADAPNVAEPPSSHYDARQPPRSADAAHDDYKVVSRAKKQPKTRKGCQISIWNDRHKFGRGEVEIDGAKYYVRAVAVSEFGSELDKLPGLAGWKEGWHSALLGAYRAFKKWGVSCVYRVWDGRHLYSEPLPGKLFTVSYDDQGAPLVAFVDDQAFGEFQVALKATGKAAGPHYEGYVKEREEAAA
ncbi:hypothetical protein [Magnetospirillum sp. 15-1]|uniref:hypothetical protein n=1 Tax=Magnetospirillum sp. 15-1 TaxID=1979370 RepID=UPI001144DA75|nr:hypothetical protein [Magnetospirillum sp. 15-1]